jgi:hypothetical protein
MIIETKFNMGDFVRCNTDKIEFGNITNIRTYTFCPYKNEIKIVTNVMYWVNGTRYYQSQITLSNQEESRQFYNNHTITTTDDMY